MLPPWFWTSAFRKPASAWKWGLWFASFERSILGIFATNEFTVPNIGKRYSLENKSYVKEVKFARYPKGQKTADPASPPANSTIRELDTQATSEHTTRFLEQVTKKQVSNHQYIINVTYTYPSYVFPLVICDLDPGLARFMPLSYLKRLFRGPSHVWRRRRGQRACFSWNLWYNKWEWMRLL